MYFTHIDYIFIFIYNFDSSLNLNMAYTENVDPERRKSALIALSSFSFCRLLIYLTDENESRVRTLHSYYHAPCK